MDSPLQTHTRRGLCFQCVGSITGWLPAAEGLLPSAATSGLARGDLASRIVPKGLLPSPSQILGGAASLCSSEVLPLSPPAQGCCQRASSLCPGMVCRNKGMTEREPVHMSSPFLQPPETAGHSCTFCGWVPAVMLSIPCPQGSHLSPPRGGGGSDPGGEGHHTTTPTSAGGGWSEDHPNPFVPRHDRRWRCLKE